MELKKGQTILIIANESPQSILQVTRDVDLKEKLDAYLAENSDQRINNSFDVNWFLGDLLRDGSLVNIEYIEVQLGSEGALPEWYAEQQ